MSSVIVGIFDTQAAANDAKNQLLVAGFANETVVVSDEDMATLRTGSVLQRTANLLRLLGLPWQGAKALVTSSQADAS